MTGARDGMADTADGPHLADGDASTITIDSNGTTVNLCRRIIDTCAVGL